WTLELAGPGLLVVDARLLGAGPDGQLEVVRDGQRLGRADLLAAHAPLTVPKDMSHGKGLKEQVLEDMNAAPPAGLVAAAGDGDDDADDADDADDEDLAAAATDAPRGPRGEVRVPLAPGRHRYELRFTGREAALRVRVGRDNPRLAAALRGET